MPDQTKVKKILFDTQTLNSFGTKKESGLFRASDEIFRRLIKYENLDIYCYVADGHDNVMLYLEKFYPGFADKIIRLPNLRKTCRDKNFFFWVKSLIYYWVLRVKYLDLLRSFDWFFSTFHPILPLISKNIKSAILVHDLIPLIFKDITCPDFHKSYDKFIRNLNCDYVFFNSKNTQNDFLKFNNHIKNHQVIYLAANDKFQVIDDINFLQKVKEKYGIADGKYLLSVGDNGVRKNIKTVIAGFCKILEDHDIDDLNLIICGNKDNIDITAFENINLFKKYQDKVIFSGFIDDSDLPILYCGSLAFIYLSLYEGFGLPVLEAMQCGCAVISSNNSSLPEVVGDCGLMVDPKRYEDLGEAIMKLYSNIDLRQRLIISAKKRAKQFCWDNCVEEITKIFLRKE